MLFFIRANLLQKNCTDSNKLQNLLVTAENVKVCLRWRDPLLNCSSILAVTQTLYALINDFHSPFDLLRFDNKRCFVFEIKTQWVWPVFYVCSRQTNTRPTGEIIFGLSAFPAETTLCTHIAWTDCYHKSFVHICTSYDTKESLTLSFSPPIHAQGNYLCLL